MAYAPKIEQKKETNTPSSTPLTTTSKATNLWKTKDSNDKKYNLVISIRGLPKVGKTHLLISSVELAEQNFMNFHIPAGNPLYVIDLENATQVEVEHHFRGQMDKIIIKDPIVLDDKKNIDYVKSYTNFKNLIDELSEVNEGILCIDGMGFLADATWFILVDKVLGYGFNDFGNPNKKPQPHEYTWRKKEMRELMTKLRHMKIPVFFTNKVKKETESSVNEKTGKDYFKFTGGYIEDSLEGTNYYYDMEITLEKEMRDNKIVRVAKIYDSRFEEEEIPLLRYVIESPSMLKIFEMVNKVLKGGK